MGPTGGILITSRGELPTEEAYWAFRTQAQALYDSGCLDAFWIETMTDDAEAIQAALAARATAPSLPLIVTMSFDSNNVPVENPTTSFGKTPKDFCVIDTALINAGFDPIDVIGANCGRLEPITTEGPSGAMELITTFRTEYPSRIIAMKLNAGHPNINGTYIYHDPHSDSTEERDAVIYDGTPAHMARYAVNMKKHGARIIGGCCGTEPKHIEAMAEALQKS